MCDVSADRLPPACWLPSAERMLDAADDDDDELLLLLLDELFDELCAVFAAVELANGFGARSIG